MTPTKYRIAGHAWVLVWSIVGLGLGFAFGRQSLAVAGLFVGAFGFEFFGYLAERG